MLIPLATVSEQVSMIDSNRTKIDPLTSVESPESNY